MRWYAAHAYTPNETATHGGGVHAIVLEDFASGRIVRKKGDVLCRPKRRFWGLHGVEKGRVVTCKGCTSLLRRFGQSLEATEDGNPPRPVQEATVTPPVGRSPNISLEEALSRIFRG